MNDIYLRTVRLLLSIAPDVFENPLFVMKGGTAINLFVQDMPRLSVDIDVVYRIHQSTREESLANIASELGRVTLAIEKQGFQVARSHIAPSRRDKGSEVKLVVFHDDVSVKVEVNYVFRGTLLEPVSRMLVPAARELFSMEVAVPTLADAELYGSKLVAAMDRQHPRDFYDAKYMYDAFGLPSDFIDAFVGYLVGHDRPVHEVLFAKPKSLTALHESEFVGMTIDDVPATTLEEVQRRLLTELPQSLQDHHRRFLLSFVRLAPEWDLMPYPHLKDMPAIRWKLQNLEKLRKSNAAKFAMQETSLRQVLDAVAH
ncbi:Nucleotidyl transferase AbiEii/AbiGii toxin family protein [Pararobbsia alpina]|uniref:nucleotidyl transferase AbiEii/AbiGii toxin family protein n=1 Tax=Pararobbsia alpina TaxID=621374 RepID=UPI0039A5F969